MLTFADFVAPLSEQDFFANYYGKKPVHMAAQPGGARRVLSFPRLNELLAIESHWTDKYLRLARDAVPIAREHYCDRITTMDGPRWRADPAKVQVFLAMGASLIANEIQTVDPALREVSETLGEKLGGGIGANCYVSFQHVQGFGPHYDLTDVIAFHCEGEKVWRLYEGRVDSPIAFPEGDDDAVREHYRRAAGKPVAEVRMRPGDALYIPRGWCHDALAQSDTSMHVTFAIAPHTGRVVLKFLEKLPLDDPAFRAYLPDGSIAGPGALKAHLAGLADRLRDIVASPRMEELVRAEQQSLRGQREPFDLPRRKQVVFYRATGKPIEVGRRGDALIARVGGAELALDGVGPAAQWLAGRPAFGDAELHARFQALPRTALDKLIADLVRLGAFAPL